MANLLLAGVILGAGYLWFRTGFHLPPRVRRLLRSRGALAVVAGCVAVLLTVGYSVGDAVAGRSQISKNPVRYATRLRGPAAHVHDLADAGVYWRQIGFQTGAGVLVGIVLIGLGRAWLRSDRLREAPPIEIIGTINANPQRRL